MQRVFLLTAASLGLCVGSVHAQGFPGVPNTGSRPAISPWLNLNRSGAPLVNNYYGLVRPEFDFRSSLQQLGTQQTVLGTQQTTLENSLTLPPTGHLSSFLTHPPYFLNYGGQGITGQTGQFGQVGQVGQFGAQTGAVPGTQRALGGTPARRGN